MGGKDIGKTKICSKCNEEKLLANFYKNINYKDGYITQCKSCKYNTTKKWRDKNPDKHKKQYDSYNKIYKSNNKEYSEEYDKKYRRNNKNSLYKYRKEYDSRPETKKLIQEQKKRYNEKHKIKLKIKGAFTRRVKRLFENKRVQQKSQTLYLLGCSILEYKQYLEKQFLPEMTWDNHGDIWEIDHIIPCAHFNIEEESEQLKCFHYLNTQPLFKTTEIAENLGYNNQIGNRNKGDKII
jgi:hypothetical protein